jgi:two-component system, chemotaxis family, sensor kinase CheA
MSKKRPQTAMPPAVSEPVAEAPAAQPPIDELAMFIADPEIAGMFIADALDHLGTIESTILKLEAAPGDLALVNDIFRPFHTVKGNADVLGIVSIQEFAHRVETLLDLARSGEHPMGPAEIDLVLKAVDLMTLIVNELPARAAGQAVTDVAVRRRDVMATIDRLLATGGVADSGVAEPANTPHPAEPERTKGGWDESTVKVDTRKLDAIVDMVGELVIAQAILAEDGAALQAADERFSRRLAQVRRITADLQRDTMAMRMVPIRQTFRRMARVVRDLGRKLDKPIDVIVSGEETELDRKVVEHLTDPLMHMVRNAVDHGIEPAARRAAAGKPVTAEVRLTAFHRAGRIVVEIADDGAGLNTGKILASAVAQGLVAAGERLEPSDVHRLIFHPGFSTADRVTDLSGRGVGMDVACRNIEALRGRIEIRTEQGRGTTFSLQVPLTLAIVEGLLVGVGADRFVIPIPAVRESLRPKPEQIHSAQGRACLVQVRNRLIPLLHLGEALGVPGARSRLSECTVIIAEDSGQPVAVAVDDLLGKQEVVIKGLGDMFRGVRGIAGGAILGDGRIGLILDVSGLLTLVGSVPSAAMA